MEKREKSGPGCAVEPRHSRAAGSPSPAGARVVQSAAANPAGISERSVSTSLDDALEPVEDEDEDDEDEDEGLELDEEDSAEVVTGGSARSPLPPVSTTTSTTTP